MKVEEQERIFNCVIIPDGYWKGFEKITKIIEQNLNIKFKQKLDDFDSYYWIFDYDKIEINLHYHEMIGDVEIFVDKKKSINKGILFELATLINSFI